MASVSAISGYKGPKPIFLKGPANYEQWKYNVQSRLMIYGVWEAIIVTKGVMPSGKEEKAQWSVNNTVCWLIIHDSLDDSMKRQMNSKAGDNAWELYERIEKLYSKSNASELIAATFKVQRMRREDHPSMVEYCAHAKYWIMRMSELGEERLPSDVCASLMVLGLPDEYRSAWERIPENADASNVHMRLEDMESALIRSETVQESVSANALKVGSFGKQEKARSPARQGNWPVCEHCGKIGHRQGKCWKLHPEMKAARDNDKKDQKEVLRASIRMVATDDDEWLLDSGAEVHITHQRHRFDTYRPCSTPISGIDNRRFQARGVGEVSFKTPYGIVQVTGVVHVPECRWNLISVAKLADKGCIASFSDSAFTVLNTKGNKIFSGPRYNGNYLILHTKQPVVSTVKAVALRDTNPESWDGVHRRLGFAGMQQVKAAAKYCDGIDLDTINKHQGDAPVHRSCEACTQGKLHHMLGRTPARNTAPEASTNKRGYRWHIDIAGGGNITHTLGGNRYLLGATCEATDRFVYRLIPDRKSHRILDFVRQLNAETTAIGSKIYYIRSDNAREFEASSIQELAKTLSITWEWTMPYSSHQNGVEERQHRTLFERVRAVLYDSGLPERFWGEAMGYVVHTKERLPSKVLNMNSTPYEQWYGKRPNIGGLRPFGTVCYAYSNAANHQKLKNRGIKCLLLGYGKGNNQYRVWNINKGDIEVSARVEFHESTVTKSDLPISLSTTYRATPGAPSANDPPAEYIATPDDVIGEHSLLQPQDGEILGENEDDEADIDVVSGQSAFTPDVIGENPSTSETGHNSINIDQQSVARQPEQAGSVYNLHSESHDDTSVGVDGGDKNINTPGDEELAEGTTQRTTQNLGNASGEVPPPVLPPVTSLAPRRSARGLPQRNYREMNHGRAAFVIRATRLDPTPVSIPKNAQIALEGEHRMEWREAMNKEFNSLINNRVWSLETPPKGRKVLKGRWVLQVKYRLDGTIERYKARWVAKGFEQVEGIDYSDIFSSVVKSSSWRTLLALGAKEDMEIELSDVDTAFLEARLNDDVWVEQPHMYGDGSNKACHLQKSLYGLKQSAREWYSTLYSHLKSMGFHRLGKDNSVFRNNNTGAIIASYVDDLLLMTRNKIEMVDIKEQLNKRFKLKHLGEIRHYLGMQITRNRATRSMHISQESYIKQLLVQLDMYGCSPSITTIDKKAKLDIVDPDYEPPPELTNAYASIIGALNWLAGMTRPDIAYAVHYLSRFIKGPTDEHLLAAKRVIRYLAGTMSLGVTFGPKGADNGDLVGYSDASWHDCKNTGRSTSAYVFKYWNGPISWRSCQQREVSMSTAEAEYLAASDACKEALYIKDLMYELHQGGEDVNTMRIFVDNTAAIQIANNPVSHERTKHISLCYHLVRDLVGKKKVHLQWASTDSMVADPLTKALPSTHHEHIKGLLNMTDGLDQSKESVGEKKDKIYGKPSDMSSLGLSRASKFTTGRTGDSRGSAGSTDRDVPKVENINPPHSDVGDGLEAS